MKFEKLEKKILIISSIIILFILLFFTRVFYEKYKYNKAAVQLLIIEDAVNNYFQDKNEYPIQLQSLVPSYLKKRYLVDPWGRVIHYKYPGKINKLSFDLLSFGKDGRQGGEQLNKDIYNNEIEF